MARTNPNSQSLISLSLFPGTTILLFRRIVHAAIMSSHEITLRPNYPRAALTTYMWAAVFAAFVSGVGHEKGAPLSLQPFLSIFVLGGTFMAIGVCVMFVPRELSYGSDGFSCRMLIQGTHSFAWDKLVAYGSGHNVFLLKFEGRQALQISSYGFKKTEWNEFLSLLKSTFPEKKCSFWLGPIPMIRKK